MAHLGPGPAGPPPLGPDGFDWTAWHPDPTVVVGLAALGGLYVVELRRGRALGKTASSAQILSYVAGLLVLLGSLTGPLHDLSDYYLFSAHMIQHLLLALAMPPLLLYATPGCLIEPLLSPPLLRRLGRTRTRPSGAFASFNLVLVAWHIPPLYYLAMDHHGVLIVQHLMIMVLSVIL